MSWITEEEIQKAVDYLRDSAKPAAVAKAQRLHMEDWLKVVKAERILASGFTTAQERESEALASQEYRAAIDARDAAVEADEKYRFLRGAAEARLAAWQTASANERGAWKA